MLVAECDAGRVAWRRPVRVVDVSHGAPDHAADAGTTTPAYRIATDAGTLVADRLVVATGGLSIPKIGATDFAFRLARRFGLRVIEPRPALVPLTFAADAWAPYAALAGVALPVRISCDGGDARAGETATFDEDLLFTHRGLSGPAALQLSTYWRPGRTVDVDFVPTVDLGPELRGAKDASRRNLSQQLALHLPRRFVAQWLADRGVDDRRLAELSNDALTSIAAGIEHWSVAPDGTEGFRKAEVTVGGVDTAGLSQRTMEALAVPGLYFIGEAVDVTGWLGGYNFQWAWSSGAACGRSV